MFPHLSNYSPNPLDLYLTTHLNSYEISVSIPLEKSDHGFISLTFPMELDILELPPR